MARPLKYKTEAERSEARREQHKKYNKKRNDKNDNNSNSYNDRNDKNYKLLYELQKIEYRELEDKYKALLYESEITNDYCRELEDKLKEAKEMGY